MDEAEVAHWFGSYLTDFAALARGDIEDVRRILLHYAVPMILSTDAGCMILTNEAQVLAATQQQIDGMRAAGYDHSDQIAAGTTIPNRSCVLHHGRFVRLRADGSEISRLDATYLITDLPAGHRISAIIVHSAP
jgi:hypothetical protein